jgi:hypothetical protein
MNLIQKIALAYLLFVITLGWGFGIGRFNWFPAPILAEIASFARGGAAEQSTLSEKLASTMGTRPVARLMNTYGPANKEEFTTVDVPGLNSWREKPRMYRAQGMAPGYRVIIGAFDFEENVWGAILLDEQGKVLHRWHMTSENLPTNKKPDNIKALYGASVLRDGSIIFILYEGGGIVKVDACSRQSWALLGDFHHTIALVDDHSAFWTFAGLDTTLDQQFALVDVKSGAILKSIDTKDVRPRNPLINIFDLQAKADTYDATHGNDVDPLPASLQPVFPGFKAGDLLISYRTTNLVYVLDPDTLEVKWWRVGAWDRQHDPDWQPDGTITVFSNNLNSEKKHSTIVSMDPRTMMSKVILDGADYNFIARYQGTHQLTRHGTMIVNSGLAGRVFEVDRNGKVVFEFINSVDWNDSQNLIIADSFQFDRDYFDLAEIKKCAR